MTQVEENNIIKIKLRFSFKSISQALLIFFGTMTIITLSSFLYFKITNYTPISKILDIKPPGYWEARLNYINFVLCSMIISGVVGISIFTPLTLSLGKSLKKLQITHLTQTSGDNKDFLNYQRMKYKPVKVPKFGYLHNYEEK
jgi:hypothetical protein